MIRPSEQLGPVLTGRAVATTLREQVEARARAGHVVVDFSGVEAMSPSFADELFAKMPTELTESGQVRFENLRDDLAALVRFVISGRHRHDPTGDPA